MMAECHPTRALRVAAETAAGALAFLLLIRFLDDWTWATLTDRSRPLAAAGIGMELLVAGSALRMLVLRTLTLRGRPLRWIFRPTRARIVEATLLGLLAPFAWIGVLPITIGGFLFVAMMEGFVPEPVFLPFVLIGPLVAWVPICVLKSASSREPLRRRLDLLLLWLGTYAAAGLVACLGKPFLLW
ncbi:hypothetical protein LAZ40_04410 [Cereibacter sphaeroides]|uniref:hypothetical protein n=1 Tax=Cereibacter sphaeroides TaxID=1063 RepID=UPI001F1D83BF|nr:hypothetical protein [Cereibacter sphaeroides]MCE6958298.1 hypothetical protein [Cereibacter sphaeroides]MCE6971908.1 hypothetical protein [Cereibacter sphaeroides]